MNDDAFRSAIKLILVFLTLTVFLHTWLTDQLRSDVSFALKKKKSGLTWGGGNIKASTATRGTIRKFLGK